MTPGTPRSKQPLYFVNAAVDFALIGGLSIATFAAFWFVGGPHGAPMPREAVLTIAAALMWVVNWPHFSATSYRLYHARANIAQYPITALVIPLLLTVVLIGSFASPEGVAPWLVKMFTIWSPYHFSAQTLGITLIYARRGGFAVTPRVRLALAGFIFGTFLVQTAVTEAGQGLGTFYTVAYPILGLPDWVPDLLRLWMWACGTMFLYFVVSASRQRGRILPPIILLPAVTQFVWFYMGWRLPAFNEFVPFFHAMQYLLIAWVMQIGETLAARAPAGRRRFVVFETLRWAAFNLVGGIVLFWALPRIGQQAGFTLPFATAVIISAVQIHHFFVDGVIWKLRNPRVASPLMSSIDDLIAGPAPLAAAVKAA